MDFLDSYRQAELSLDAGQPAEAALVLAHLVAHEPRNPALLTLLGRAYLPSAQLHRAESTLRRLVELQPGDAYARHALGRTLRRLSRHVEADAQLRLAAAMHPAEEYVAAAFSHHARAMSASSSHAALQTAQRGGDGRAVLPPADRPG